MTPRDLYNKLFSKVANGYQDSFYYTNENGTKAVRVSGHYANSRNFWLYNEGVSEIFLVYITPEDVNEDTFEREINEGIKDIESELGVYVDYCIFSSEVDFEYTKNRVDRFLRD